MRSTIRPTMVVPVPHACVLVLLSRCLSVSAAFPVPSVARVLREKKVVISFSYLKHTKKGCDIVRQPLFLSSFSSPKD